MIAYAAFVALCAVLWFAALAAIWITDAHERRALEVLALLDTEAADWDEPSRADVEARFHTFDAPTLADALGITDADDYSWDASRLPLSQSPVAQRIREQIVRNECRRFRAELDGWGGDVA